MIIEGQEEAPTTSSDISGFQTDQPYESELPATTGSAALPMKVMERETMIGGLEQSTSKCENCDLLKRENKRMHNWWQTSKQKLAAVREELRVLRGAAGKHVLLYPSSCVIRK